MAPTHQHRNLFVNHYFHRLTVACALQQSAVDVAEEEEPLDFSPDGDVDNPREWPAAFKWTLTVVLTILAFSVTFNCMSLIPVAGRIVTDLAGGKENKNAAVLLVTIWELGEAAGPLLIAPLSETIGRWPVMVVANGLFVLFTVFSASAPSVPLFILSRALMGLVVSSNVLSPAVIGDVFDPERRGSPMSLVMVAPIVGSALGPALGGALSESYGWRAVLWIAAAISTITQVLLLTCSRETYKVVILRVRQLADRKRAIDAGETVVDKFGLDSRSQRAKLLRSIVRPFVVFGSSGVLMALSFFGSVIFAQMYNINTTLPDILQVRYGLSPVMTGTALISVSIGSVFSVGACNLGLDRIYAHMKASNAGIGQPEFRLPIVVVGALTQPVAIALYGWAAELLLPLPVMLFATGLLGATLMLGFLPLASYVVDAFGLYSASAMTGLIVSRCLAGTFLPLLTTPLVDGFGYGWGFTVLAVFNLCLAPIPMAILRYGHVWRKRCEYTACVHD
ncbi:putative arabinose efflux permease, MFS family [Geosmithia morbida]|uniref:Arabinose efflux permease, MFS family n=1 Tax=Geosmithia morbida TaxID=1094350 RepID=A0A9P4Z140_9HYPO|nr:putative arabinose efflux permease, MFS family [Geosmithia morbida]KAF4125486.1 putative arabinose efflux permease, MFS family [Geosmithia morbida]